jgi:hypothetical protein
MLTCVLSKLPAKLRVNLQVTRDIRKVELGEPVKLRNRKIYTYKAKKEHAKVHGLCSKWSKRNKYAQKCG